MTNKEKLEKACELIDEANKLIDEVANSEPEVEPEDPVAEYRKRLALCDKYAYYIDLGGVYYGCAVEFDEDNYNPYFQFIDASYADEAVRLHKLICMQLAFKWCHDRDFKPDWKDVTQTKYYLNIDLDSNLFIVDSVRVIKRSVVCFSTSEIAQKCADWLNSLDRKKGDLI